MAKLLLKWMGEHPFLTFFIVSALCEAFVKSLPFIGAHPYLSALMFSLSAVVLIVAITVTPGPCRCEDDDASEGGDDEEEEDDEDD